MSLCNLKWQVLPPESPAWRESFSKAVHDTDAIVRRAVADAINPRSPRESRRDDEGAGGVCGEDSAWLVQQLAPLLKDESNLVRVASGQALQRIPASAAQPLAKQVAEAGRDLYPGVRACVAETLGVLGGGLGDGAEVESLLRLVRDQEPAVRLLALDALLKVYPEGSSKAGRKQAARNEGTAKAIMVEPRQPGVPETPERPDSLEEKRASLKVVAKAAARERSWRKQAEAREARLASRSPGSRPVAGVSAAGERHQEVSRTGAAEVPAAEEEEEGHSGAAMEEALARLLPLPEDSRHSPPALHGRPTQIQLNVCSALADRLTTDPDPGVRAAALDAIAAWNGLASPYGMAVVQRAGDTSELVRHSAARCIARLATATAPHVGTLMAMISAEGQPEARGGAVEALSGSSELALLVQHELITCLPNPNPAIREAGAAVLVAMGPAAYAGTGSIIGLARHPKMEVRAACIQALVAIGEAGKDFADKAVELLQDQDPEVKKAGEAALVGLGCGYLIRN